MPSRQRLRPLKAWRYVGVYGPELMICLGAVRIGPGRQSFWAVWDRARQQLHQRTSLGRGSVHLGYGFARLREASLQIELTLEETAGVETVCRSGASYAWTRKQGGVRARGSVWIDGSEHRLDARAVIDDTAAYYQRHTSWRWSAGVGLERGGLPVAWNLVDGVNDPPSESERTIWVGGVPSEVGPARFAADLSAVSFGEGELRFAAEAVRERRENLVVVRSFYRQPFGTFAGRLGGGVELAVGYGVMEEHEVWW